MNLSTGKEHRGVREEVDAIEAYSEPTRSCGIESLVAAGDFTDSREVVLIFWRDLPNNPKPRVVADEKSWLQERTIFAATLWRKALSVPLVQGHNQFGSAGIVCVLNELFDNRTTK